MTGVTRTRGLIAVAVTAVAATGAIVALTALPGNSNGDGRSAPSRTTLKHESLIATCMHDRGFDYIVAVPRDVAIEEARRAAARNGRDQEAAVARAQAEVPPDANAAAVGALPPERQQAWGDALFGDATWPGCYYVTYEQAWGVDLEQEARRADAAATGAHADPRVRAAERAYLECMTGRGYPVTGLDDVDRQIAERRGQPDATAAEEWSKAASAAHDTCITPYQKAYDAAYLQLVGRS